MVEFRKVSDTLAVLVVPLNPVHSNFVLSDINFGSYIAWSSTASSEELNQVQDVVTLTLHKGPGQKEFVPHGPYKVDFCTDGDCDRCKLSKGGYKFRMCSSRWTPLGAFCWPTDEDAPFGTVARSPGAARFWCQREQYPAGALRFSPQSSQPRFLETLALGGASFRAASGSDLGQLEIGHLDDNSREDQPSRHGASSAR